MRSRFRHELGTRACETKSFLSYVLHSIFRTIDTAQLQFPPSLPTSLFSSCLRAGSQKTSQKCIGFLLVAKLQRMELAGKTCPPGQSTRAGPSAMAPDSHSRLHVARSVSLAEAVASAVARHWPTDLRPGVSQGKRRVPVDRSIGMKPRLGHSGSTARFSAPARSKPSHYTVRGFRSTQPLDHSAVPPRAFRRAGLLRQLPVSLAVGVRELDLRPSACSARGRHVRRGVATSRHLSHVSCVDVTD